MKKQTKSQQILAMVRKGMTTAQIVEKLNTTPAHVYVVKSAAKKKKERKQAQKQNRTQEPLQFISPITNAPVIVTPIPDAVQVGGDHYKDNTIQVWDAIHDWGLGYFSGNVIKYVARHQKKNGVEDLKKARHYLDKLIAMSEKQAEVE